MSATIVIRNLPDEADESQIRAAIAEALKIENLELLPDKGTSGTKRLAIVQVDMPMYEAEALAQKWNGRIIGGRPIQVAATLFMH